MSNCPTIDTSGCPEISCCDEPIFGYSSECPTPVPPAPPPCDNPVITVQPQSVSVIEPSVFMLVVMATGAYSYQWLKDDVEIPGANNSSLLVASSSESDSGVYTVRIGGLDDCFVISEGADVMVSNPDNPCEHFAITSDADLGSERQTIDEVEITLTATGGASPYTWILTAGSLPDGLSLSTDGIISGTISGAPGPYSFTIQATDSNVISTCQTTKVFDFEVLENPCLTLEITSDFDLGFAARYDEFTATFAATGGTLPYTWSLQAGTLPAGLTLSEDGTLSGTITGDLDTYVFEIRVTDSNSPVPLCHIAKEFSITVLSPCDERVLADSLDATSLRNWFIDWTGIPTFFDGPPYYTWDGILPRTRWPGDPAGITFNVRLDDTRSIGFSESPPGSCLFGGGIGVDCFALWNVGSGPTLGPVGQYGPPISARSAACEGNQPAVEFITLVRGPEFPPIPSQSLTPDAAWWKFDEGSGSTAADSSGNGNTANLTGSPSWVAGHIGPSALEFNGSNYGLSINPPLALAVEGEWTIACWMKKNSNPALRGAWFLGNQGATNKIVVSLLLKTTGVVYVQMCRENISCVAMPDSPVIPTGEWHHFAVTYYDKVLRLFIDGVFSRAIGNDIPNIVDGTTAGMYLGYYPGVGGINGTLDDVRVYSYALNAADVATLAAIT